MWSSTIKANRYIFRTWFMNAGHYRECARLHACCMGLDKVDPWIIFTWQKPWINHNWLALSHTLVPATRLDLQFAAEMDNGCALWWWLASLTSWNGSHHGTQTNSLSQLTDPFTRCHTCCAVLNGLAHPIRQTMTRPAHTHITHLRGKSSSPWQLQKLFFPVDLRTHIHAQCPSHSDKHRQW